MFGLAIDEDVEDDRFAVFEENWATVELFRRLSTQWQVAAGMGGMLILGLNYGSVESVMRIMKVKRRREMLDDLRVMELAALEKLNAKAA